MPIASYKPDADIATAPNTPVIQPESYKGVVQDDRNTPLHSLVAYISGAPWAVEYYSQIVGASNDLSEVDANRPNALQQYRRINKLELRVSTPLDSSFDSATGLSYVEGTATIYPFIVPNVSDYFITDAGDNQPGLFRIKSVQRLTFNRDSAFQVQYHLVGYLSQQEELVATLRDKTIREYHFSKERLLEGISPLLTTENYDKVVNLDASYHDLVNYYMATFFSRRKMTLVIPGQEVTAYDHYLVNYFLKIVDTLDNYDIRNIRMYGTDFDEVAKQPQFWQAMLDRDYSLLKYCNQTMGLASKAAFQSNSYIHGAFYSQMDYLVYPDSHDSTVATGGVTDGKLVSSMELIDSPSRPDNIIDAVLRSYITPTKTYDLYYKVRYDGKYVLSANFYNGTEQQSVLEILVKDYMKRSTIDLNMLYAVLHDFRSWERLEQFYYGPILMTLIKEADRSIY